MITDTDWARRIARHQFEEARRRALLAALLDAIRRQPNDLLAFEEVRARLNIRGQRYLGHQVVPLDRIVGSEGRYGDFDRRFLPRSDASKNRWTKVNDAMIRDVALPPIDLYKIGEVFFVRDGNHRVSVARQRGQTYIDAFVTELMVDVPLAPDLSVRDLLLKEEYSDFLEWTSLADLRPAQRIEFTELGGYLELVRHINGHRFFLNQSRETPVTRDEAVASWYDNVYLPVVAAIHAQNALEHFPGRTEADLYRWVMDHRWYMREALGEDPGPDAAAAHYVAEFGHYGIGEAIERSLREALGRLRR
jgi:hypothetical protein